MPSTLNLSVNSILFRIFTALIIFASIFVYPSNIFAASLNLDSPQTSLSKDEELKVNLFLSINSPDNTEYFLRGVFFKEGTTLYCGITWNGTEWFSGPYTSGEGWKKFLKIKISNNSWQGDIKAKIDNDDSDCKDSGNYKFKIERFTNSGYGSFDSQNDLSLSIVLPTSTPTPLPTSTPLPTATKIPTPTKIPSPTKIPTVVKEKIMPTVIQQLILGEKADPTLTEEDSTKSAYTEKEITFLSISPTISKQEKKLDVNGVKKNNFTVVMFLGIGLGMIFGCGILLFRKYRSKLEVDDYE